MYNFLMSQVLLHVRISILHYLYVPRVAHSLLIL